jgi:hypothetical protein
MGYDWRNRTDARVEDLKGLVFHSVKQDDGEVVFTMNDGTKYIMYHEQDCCENVYIEDVCGDISDLENTPILTAEERANYDDLGPLDEYDDSYTWTFYEFRTIKGSVTIRWYGTSNGYYSESVDIIRIAPEAKIEDCF